MKTFKRLRCWIAVFCMVLIQMMSLMSVQAAQTEQTVSVTVTLDQYGGELSGVTFAVYQVADAVTEDGAVSFKLTESFAASDVSLDVETAEQMLALIETLESYIAASAVTPVVTLTTDASGICAASGLAQGMYLLVPGNAEGYGEIAASLIALPFTGDDGSLQYEETLVPKYTPPVTPDQPTVPPTTPARPPSGDVPILGIEDISPYIGIGLLAVGIILLVMAVVLLLRRKH